MADECHDSSVQAISNARAAFAAHNWPLAYELLSDANSHTELSAEDLDALADTAWWLGRLDDSVAARERAYESHVKDGARDRAAMAALSVSLALGDRGDEALAAGWRARAYRLAEEEPDSLTSGYLLGVDSDAAFHAGSLEECLDKAKEAQRIGEIHGDKTLIAFGLHLQGQGLVQQGHIAEGWARLDESMVAVAGRDLKPVWVGLMHCGMLLACEHLADPRRGWQWVETTEKWLADHPGAVLYSGVCRIHKVRFMQLRGIWPDAEAEAWRARDDLTGVHVYTAARCYYEIGEIKRLRGDYDEAQELYQKAHQHGWDPQPGLAQLRLAQGRIEAAAAGIRRALDGARDKPAAAALLPHRIEIALATGELDEAASGADRLGEIAEEFHSPGMLACAATARGAVFLARGDARAAVTELRDAIGAWLLLDCPYEVARARVLSAAGLQMLGDEDGATFELEAARKTFEDLGALPDCRRVTQLLRGDPRPGGLTEREIEVLRLIAAGRSNKEIASELVISERTVARHVSNIFTKVGVPSRAAAASFALKQGLA